MHLNVRANPLLLTDAYNLHHGDLKVNVDFETSHLYNRKQGMLLYGFEELVQGLFTVQLTHDMIAEAVACADKFGLTFPALLFTRVVDELDGFVPLHVQALPEGTWCPAGTPFAQICNTVAGFGELVSWWEGPLMHSYFASSCATEALRMRLYLEELQEKIGADDTFLLRFHSFGFRGHRSLEDAYWAASAWSLFLPGTSTFMVGAHHPNCAATAIIATAHKVVQQFDSEYECFTRAIDVAHSADKTIVALVIDTYDAYNVINNYVLPLSAYATARQVHIVFRPDSGDTWKQACDIYDIVKAHRLSNVSVIIGEGMSFIEAQKADVFFQKNNVPLTFIKYGIGAGFFKHIERDTLGFAMKTAFSNGAPRMKFSENPLKRSIPGRVSVGYNASDSLQVWQEDEGRDSLYRSIYHFDPSCAHTMSTYAQTREAALRTMRELQDQQTEQLYIQSSEKTKSMIAQFKSKYRS